ncbi:MAG: hypothetical protein FWG73_03535 [Planctomycetaceae bacterium]|nr:hypothetical protein [Planctomycetaceae bacterium]
MAWTPLRHPGASRNPEVGCRPPGDCVRYSAPLPNTPPVGSADDAARRSASYLLRNLPLPSVFATPKQTFLVIECTARA